MHFTTTEIAALMGSYFWPFVRIAALITAAPMFSSNFVPMRARLVFAVGLTVVIAPVIPPVPQVDALSGTGLFIILQQILIGIATGFLLHLVFNAFIVGAQVIAMQMGLGFASMLDPQNGSQAPVLSMFYVLMVTLLFLVMDGHLALIGLVAQSFHTMPIGPEGLAVDSYRQVAQWATQMFEGALLISLPAVTALFVVNMALGVIGRAAPQFNLFAVGFAIMMPVGFYVMMVTLPSTMARFEQLMSEAMNVGKNLPFGG